MPNDDRRCQAACRGLFDERERRQCALRVLQTLGRELLHRRDANLLDTLVVAAGEQDFGGIKTGERGSAGHAKALELGLDRIQSRERLRDASFTCENRGNVPSSSDRFRMNSKIVEKCGGRFVVAKRLIDSSQLPAAEAEIAENTCVVLRIVGVL